ncbi:flagellar biosynthesis regulator FlaF [Roseomonas sp. HJA6]|uniref:Flagellar biosynthesis regulator FlaF n=1 Tax=Roseomonas alba TaxID=2846776 RepID=A0ABS7A8X7_9PROT|nr:flagellar biosynthesis regulator FlaF [Neoroseomonas alba]MBW6398550.1 flagellar biosynthesis regulator FlaF [Neoroseomonas alba]
MTLADFVRAYGAARAARDPREQEAEVIRRVTFGLRGALQDDGPARIRAVADNRRLWLAMETALVDPSNQLPTPMRAGLVSLGRAVLREMDTPSPDIDFLIEVNEQVAAGLTG